MNGFPEDGTNSLSRQIYRKKTSLKEETIKWTIKQWPGKNKGPEANIRDKGVKEGLLLAQSH